MNATNTDPLQSCFTVKGAKVAVLGYEPDARAHALALRRGANAVRIALEPDAHDVETARLDEFTVEPIEAAVRAANIVVAGSCIAARVFEHVTDGAIVVFACGHALQSSSPCRGLDVVLVAGSTARCRVAVRQDATGRALVRAIAYARTVFGPTANIAITSVGAELDSELAAIGERPGSVLAFLGTLDEARDESEPGPTPEAQIDGSGEWPSFASLSARRRGE
jgi:ketol-acid reductoisomerase